LKRIRISRIAVQAFSLLLLNLGFISILETGVVCPAFYCYGCPAASAACPIGALQTFTAVRIFPYYILGSLGLFGLLLGRFWCGWVCPFGTLQDLIMRLRHRRDAVNLPSFPWTKYLSLIGIIIAAWITLDTVFCKVCPSGSLFAAIPHRFISADDFSFGTFFYVHLATLGVAIILFVLIGRFWCRYLCPLGAIFGLFNRISLIKVHLDKSKCTECLQCLRNCPANFSKLEDIGTSSDCIQCARCISECPTDSISIAASVKS